MKKLIAVVCFGFFFIVSSSVFAGGQQEKMKGCNKEAKGAALKGDERKAFMKKCLSKDYVLKANGAAAAATPAVAEPAAPASTQQDKMKSCNADAKTKGLKGEERKVFMSSCLKG
ncbi:MAG TPA: PsiF family protein [Gallionella sp.]|nr:PsiF family protein [Gallionella sp.]